MTETVGYIGLGAIGSLMAQRIRQASYPLMVWNRSPDKYGELERMGATVASSPAELAARCPVICICVSATAPVEHVVFGIDGIAGTAGPPTGAYGRTSGGARVDEQVQISGVAADQKKNKK